MYFNLRQRQLQVGEKIRHKNAHENRLLSENMARKHGLADARARQSRSMDREIRDLKKEFARLNSSANVSERRRFSNIDCIVRCRKVSDEDAVRRSNDERKTKRKEKGVARASQNDINGRGSDSGSGIDLLSPRDDNGLSAKIEATKKAPTIDAFTYVEREEKNILNPSANVNHRPSPENNSHNMSPRKADSLIDVSTEAGKNFIEFVEEDEITYKTDPNRRRRRHLQKRHSIQSIPVPPASLVVDHPTFYNNRVGEPDSEEGDPTKGQLDISDPGQHLTVTSGLLAMAVANNNFLRSQSVDYGLETQSVGGESASDVMDASRPNMTRRGSKVAKMTDLLRPAKFDREKYNPDGSVRTVHKLPDFNKSYEQARRARYIRSKETLERERELTSKDIFQGLHANTTK